MNFAKPFEILFLDEPSNELDIEMVDWLKKTDSKDEANRYFHFS